jgi:hypothetical protein
MIFELYCVCQRYRVLLIVVSAFSAAKTRYSEQRMIERRDIAVGVLQLGKDDLANALELGQRVQRRNSRFERRGRPFPSSSIDKLHDLPHLDQKECQRRTQRQDEQKFPNP